MNWDYVHIDSREDMIMSGWKLYILGNTVAQGKLAEKLLLNFLKEYNLTVKIATKDIIDRNKVRKIPWSSMVIYLNEEVFRKNISSFLNQINTQLRTYPFQGKISGARSLNGKIHYRYDLKIPVNPLKGIIYDEYYSLYRGESGNYNILNNKDVLK